MELLFANIKPVWVVLGAGGGSPVNVLLGTRLRDMVVAKGREGGAPSGGRT